MPSKSQLISRLRSQLTESIADYKAYDVPAVCERLGLESGTEQEAFNGKRRYAQKRLAKVSSDLVIEAAKSLLEESEDFLLSELLELILQADKVNVSELTRQRIVSVFSSRPLSTEKNEVDFLSRVWPIASLHSPYENEGTMEESIWRHVISFPDWDNEELLNQLGIMSCSESQFFLFLREVTHPLVQSAAAQTEIADRINDFLRHDGFILRQHDQMSGSPIFSVVALDQDAPLVSEVSQTLAAFNPDNIHTRWQAALSRRKTDPAGAITLARTLLEDVCKWILHECGEEESESDELPSLYRKLAKQLNLAPDGHTEQIFKQILGSCQSIVESLGALRNKLGDAHSGGPLRSKPHARHAELAVNLAGTMATFLVATWQAKKLSRATT